MINISIVQIGVILGIVLFSILLGRWLGRKSAPKARDVSDAGSVKFFSSAKDRDTTIFMLLCFATVWLLARWFQEHIDVATVSLVLGSLITVIITMGAALYPEGNAGNGTDEERRSLSSGNGSVHRRRNEQNPDFPDSDTKRERPDG